MALAISLEPCAKDITQAEKTCRPYPRSSTLPPAMGYTGRMAATLVSPHRITLVTASLMLTKLRSILEPPSLLAACHLSARL